MGVQRRPQAAIRFVMAVVAVMALMTVWSAVDAGATPTTSTTATTQRTKLLDRKVHGKAALQAVQAKGLVDVVAKLNGQTAAKLTSVLGSDETATLDVAGRLFFVERTRPAAAPAAATAPYPYAQTFTLHSRPSSTKKIFLKFNGFTTTATSAWGVFTGIPYDTDGVPGSFSTAEQDTIQSIWQRMAEDYAPFDVDVTTQDPGAAAIDRTDAADQNYGTRVVFTNADPTPLCGGPCGGVAYIDVFSQTGTHEIYQPAWVFANWVPGAKNMAEAGTHEAGHNFGLSHDGCSSVNAACGGDTEYYEGHDNWAPIMGAGYYEPVTQWSKGQYPLANNTEDDLAIIAQNTPLVPDEDGNTTATARNLGVSYGQLQTGSGIITSAADRDYFRFYAAMAGTVQLKVTPAPNSPNLDARLSLYNAAGRLMWADPVSGAVSEDLASGMDASFTYDLPAAGAYYLVVEGSSTASATVTGYTTYGSLGRYTVTEQLVSMTGESFAPVTTTRLLDTRPTALAAGSIRTLKVTGVGGVPTGATAVALNVAAVTPNLAGHLRVYPTGAALPTASSLNFSSGQNVPNAVVVKVGTGGQINLYAGNSTNVLVDVVGYYVANPNVDQFTSVVPSRITSMTLAPLTTTAVTVLGAGGIPATGPQRAIGTVVLNVGALSPTGSGHLRVWPTGAAMPNASTNNFSTGDGRMNLAVVQPGTGGKVNIYNASNATVTLTVDTVGYYTWGGLGFVPMAPQRTVDTRTTAVVPAGGYVEGQVRGFAGIPNKSDVVAVVVNVAAVNPTTAGSVDVGPSGANPALPSFTHPANQNVANLVIARVGSDGKIRLRNSSTGTTHLLADIVGYYTN